MNKNKLFLVLLGAIVWIGCPFVAYAQLHSYGPSVNIRSLVHSIENAVGLIFGGVAVVSFLVAGMLFLTARGEPEKLHTARSAVIWGVAGVVVGILAFSIIAIVSRMLI